MVRSLICILFLSLSILLFGCDSEKESARSLMHLRISECVYPVTVIDTNTPARFTYRTECEYDSMQRPTKELRFDPQNFSAENAQYVIEFTYYSDRVEAKHYDYIQGDNNEESLFFLSVYYFDYPFDRS